MRYFMASTDPIADNTGFAVREHADFPILSDPKKEVAGKYGVLGLVGFASRWTYYIGKDGTPRDRQVDQAGDVGGRYRRNA